MIAFRMIVNLLSFRKEVSNGRIIIRNGTTNLGLFTDLVSASLLGVTDLFSYHDKLNTVFQPEKFTRGPKCPLKTYFRGQFFYFYERGQ